MVCLLLAYRDSLKPLYLFLERDRCFFLALGSAKGACFVACDSKVFRKGYSLLRSERALYLYFLSSVWRAMGSLPAGCRLISDHFAVFLPCLRVKAYDSDAIGTYLLVSCKPDGLRVHWLIPPRWIWLSPSHQLYMGLYLLCCDYSIAYFRCFCNTIFAQISQKVFVHDVKNWHKA